MKKHNEIPFSKVLARLEKAIQYEVGMHGLNTLLYGANRKGIICLRAVRKRAQRCRYKYMTLKELKRFSEYAGYDLTKD